MLKVTTKAFKYSVSKYLLLSLILVNHFSCAQGRLDPILDDVGMTEQDVKNSIIKSRTKNKKNQQEEKNALLKSKDSLPQLNRMIAPMPIPKIGGEKIISFYVTDQVPLRDVLVELGRIAQIDVDVDPKISGGVIINAKNRPFKEVVDRIATQANLRYSYKNKVLYFEADSPYMKNYFVDYLNESPLWDEVQQNVQNILNNNNNINANANNSDAVASVAPNSNISLNKSAGIISVYASHKQHQEVQKYLDDVSEQSSVQVLIEAKVVEVALSEKFRAGIDWSQDMITFNSPSPATDLAPFITSQNPAMKIFGGDINVAVDAMSKFGTTKAISSPRIHAMNNQKASLNFAEKLIYFKVEATQSNQANTTGGAPIPIASTITSTRQEENVGVAIEITPSINIRTGEISMNIAPRITQKTGEVKDPATGEKDKFETGNVVPVINTREINTSVKIASGNVVILGGLMKDTSSGSESGIPFLRRIPILGWLFKSIEKNSDVSETVIFIKATIINSGSKVNKIDREIQEKYDVNRRNFF